jgi:hypothetical protein
MACPALVTARVLVLTVSSGNATPVASTTTPSATRTRNSALLASLTTEPTVVTGHW